jgi:hypothetical protein
MTHNSNSVHRGFTSIVVSLANGIIWTVVLSGLLAVLLAIMIDG